jgi:hypothetical protein
VRLRLLGQPVTKSDALAKEKQYGGKFPPDNMPINERNRLITEWLAGGDDFVREPSARLEIAKDGTIILVTGKSEAQDSVPLDRWLAENARQA